MPSRGLRVIRRVKFRKTNPSQRVEVAVSERKSGRHIASPATLTEIAKTLGVTRRELARADRLVDRLGL